LADLRDTCSHLRTLESDHASESAALQNAKARLESRITELISDRDAVRASYTAEQRKYADVCSKLSDMEGRLSDVHQEEIKQTDIDQPKEE
ncbi:hypothetical protein ADUPG1_004716, partial [Aduncisulcus paluster]